MVPRKKPTAPVAERAQAPAPRPGLPVRLLPHDWPFLYSVLANGDLVLNQRLPRARVARQRAAQEDDDALM